MRFMMMVIGDKDYEAGLPPTSEPLARGLLTNSAGARVRASGWKFGVTDGPFIETKELLGGYAIVEAKSREEAVEPGKRFVEVHAKPLESHDGEYDVRQLFDATDCAPG